MSLHCSRRLPHSKPSYPQQMPSYTDSTPSPLVSPPLPLFVPTLPMGTIHRHLKRKCSGISNEASQKEDPCTRPMRGIKRPRRWGPDGRVVQAGAVQPVAVAILRPPKEPIRLGGTKITAVTSTWRIRPASRDDESSESDTSDDEEETTATHTTRYLATSCPRVSG
jgi:hypothetical protein